MKKTLRRYLVSEILPPFLLGLMAFTFILLIARILKLLELVVTRGVPLSQIAKLFALILPTFLEMTLPMALLLGIFLGLGRLSSDQEILALKTSGISPPQILLPIGILAALISLITFFIANVAGPQANLALKKELYQIAKNRITTALREKVFNDDFPKVLIYVEEILPGNNTEGVLIVDRRDPIKETIIFGKVALINSDEESKTLSLKLIDGTAYERKKRRTGFSRTSFNTYDFKLDLEDAFSPIRKKERAPKEMSLRRLMNTIRLKKEQRIRPTSELIEFHQRFSFAFAPIVFSLLGVSLVLLPTRAPVGRSWGLALCLSWLFIYYLLLSFGKAIGEREFVPAALALWLPNIVVGLTALSLFRKALKESPLILETKLEAASIHLRQRLAQSRKGIF